MIIGTGVDIVDIARIAEMRERQGERFFERIYTEGEVAYCMERKKNSDQSLAARFAAKEAAMKAFGTGWSEGIGFRTIEVVREGDGAPRLVFHGKAAELAQKLGVSTAHLSLSHTDNIAIAQVVFESEG
ncbi:MAG: holo-ACP synthase [Planctomycetes bacterium]|nr:holo-ACP synthase [Planctomycetota bacterium]